jgi:putative phosphoribosyl transferase
VMFAAPVGPSGIHERLDPECDACVILETPDDLRAVGSWYREFDQTTDAEVMSALTGSPG